MEPLYACDCVGCEINGPKCAVVVECLEAVATAKIPLITSADLANEYKSQWEGGGRE